MVTSLTVPVAGPVPMRSQAGFTLVEMLLSMLVGLGLMTAAVMVTRQVTQAANPLFDGAIAQEEGQFAIDWVTAALRSAGANPYGLTVSACPSAGTVFAPIAIDPNGTGLADNVRIQADINPPNGVLGGLAGACTERNEDVTIAHDVANQTITRRDNNLDAAAVDMTDRVITRLRFTYLDSARVVTAVPAQVAYIQVTLTAGTPSRDEIRGQPTTYVLTSEVRIRLR